MNRLNDHDTSLEPDSESERLRSIFEAAADPAPPLEAPPFFASRIRARAGEARGATTRSPLALAAARLLPVFAVIAVLLVAAAGYESAVSANEREAAVAQALARNGGSDAVLGAVLLASPDDGSTGGSR